MPMRLHHLESVKVLTLVADVDARVVVRALAEQVAPVHQDRLVLAEYQYMNDKLFFRKIISVLAVVVVIVAAVELWDHFEHPSSNDLIAPAYSALKDGNYTSAALSAQQALSQTDSGLSPQDATWAHLIIADSNMIMATDSTSQEQSLSAIVTDYQGLTDPFSRAWDLDRLVELVASSNQGPVSAVLLSNQELGHFVASTTGQTAMNIALYSYGIYPTSAAAYYAAMNDSQIIFNSISSANSPSTVQVLANAKQDALSWLSKGDEMRAIETQYASSSPYGAQAYTALTAYYRSFPISAVATIDHSHLPDAEATYQAIYDAYANTQTQAGSYPQIMLAVIAAHLNEAYMLDLIDPKANAAAIEENLKSYVALIQTNTAALEKIQVIIPFIYAPSTAPSSDFDSNEIAAMQTQHAVYLQLAAISPEFKAFLVSNGWKFSQ
jgi:hypothetical protein